MVNINQQNRLLEFIVSDCEEEFILTHFEGEEALFHGFEFKCDVFSTCLDIEALDLFGKSITIKIHDTEFGVRVFNGKVIGIKEGIIDYQSHRQYHFVISSWLHGLSFVEDCRIFQGLTVPQIFTTICKEFNMVDYDLTQLKNNYAVKDYCVQYNEATYYFIHRLFEEAGIYYYYTHEEDKHVLHLVDSGAVLPKYPESLKQTNVHHTDKHFHEWQSETSFHSTRLTLGNYQLKRPEEVPLIAAIQSRDDLSAIQCQKQFEQYRYGTYFITNQAGQLIARREIQAIEWPHHLITAKGNYPTLSPGLRFNLNEHEDKSALGNYQILSVYHKAIDQTHFVGWPERSEAQHSLVKNVGLRYRSGQPTQLTAPNASQQSYLNTIKCLPDQHVYQPLPLTKKPKIDGTHTAIVVGPKGKAIHADEYGRVKVRFYWERYGGVKLPITVLDEHCSCWARLLQPVVGNGWGMQFIPRVGDEVSVGFINSDPDRPIVIDSVYNANNREPFPLPENQNISGIQTQIINEQNNEAENRGHTIAFDDTPNQEEMLIHSEGDLNVDILNTLFHSVDGGETISVNQEMLTQVLNGKTSIKAKEIHLIVGNSSLDIDDNGVSFNTPYLELLTTGGGALKPVARVGDDHHCPKHTAGTPHKGGPILKGSSFLKVNGIPVAREGDPLHCRIGKDKIKKGIDSITVDGIPIAKVTNKTTHGGVITRGSSNVFIGEYDGPSVNLPLIKPQQRQTYWITYNYPKPDQLTRPDKTIDKAFEIDYQGKKEKALKANNAIDQYAAGEITLDKPDQLKLLQLSNSEIIAVNDKPIDTPLDTIKVTNGDFKGVTSEDKKPKRKKNEKAPKSPDKILHATTLYPPMIVNLRNDRPKDAKNILTDEQIRHIKSWGNNITIFIHGFAVAYGEFPKQIQEIKVMNKLVRRDNQLFADIPVITHSRAGSDRTIYSDIKMMTKRFPCLSNCKLDLMPDELQKDKGINGSEAHNWLLHMEDNLNRATGQFDRTDYRKFTRCVHVAWSGDVGRIHYMQSEDRADEAGKNLQDLIIQLHNAGIKINIIAHSMGNRVLLKMMDLLGAKGKADLIEHVFMCEAAVPNSALSNNPAMDISVKGNCKFTHAYKAAKKISVLYSNRDGVLKRDYILGNHIVALKHQLDVQDFLIQSPRHQARIKAYLEQAHKIEVQVHLVDWDNSSTDDSASEDISNRINALRTKINEEQLIQLTIRPALGYNGPDMSDKFITDDLIKTGKLILANTTKWIGSHSVMKFGTPEIIKHIYHDQIIKAPGFKFGIY